MPDLKTVQEAHPMLCESLRWKGMYIWGESDPTVQASNSGYFWCMHTQTSLGPDGGFAEPTCCESPDRKCHKMEMPLA